MAKSSVAIDVTKTRCFIVVFIMIIAQLDLVGQHLFVVAGQSNAMGVGDYHTSPVCIANSAFEYRLSTDELLPLADPVGEDVAGFEVAKTGSAWPSFAKTYHAISNQQVIIVPAARSGSSLNPSYLTHLRWDSLGDLWSAGAEKIQKSISKTNVQLKGVIWCQGEADASFINAGEFTKAEYKHELKSLIKRLRFKFNPTLPFYIILTGYAQGEDSRGYEAIQAAQQEVCSE
ncbi:MAG: sialate O-acetylesterase [Bacteroidota bacterium]